MAFLRARSRSAERTLGRRRRLTGGARHLERVRVGLRVRAAALEVLATHEARVHVEVVASDRAGLLEICHGRAAGGESGGARRVEGRATHRSPGVSGCVRCWRAQWGWGRLRWRCSSRSLARLQRRRSRSTAASRPCQLAVAAAGFEYSTARATYEPCRLASRQFIVRVNPPKPCPRFTPVYCIYPGFHQVGRDGSRTGDLLIT
eukprot:scaffold41654_cov37-Phaeocystis_antarctica.AAC.3